LGPWSSRFGFEEGEEINQQVQEEIKKTLEAGFPAILNFQAKNFVFTNQQKDGASCGVITSENGKGIIEGNLTAKLQILYEKGAIQTREQHLKEVDSENFNVKQKENKGWKEETIKIDGKYLRNIIEELGKLRIFENENFQKKEGPELGLFLRDDLLTKAGGKETPLWKLLIKDENSEKLEFCENALNALIEAKKHMARMLQKEEKKETKFYKKEQTFLFQHHITTTEREKKVALEPDTFKTLVTKDLFVDKTLFIRDVLNCSSNHMLITRPRRWGKTLNMDMLKTFLEKIEIYREASGVTQEEQIPNKNSFNGQNTKKNLKIWSDPHIDTRKITQFLLQSDENNEKFSLDRTNLDLIYSLIEFLDNSEDKDWPSIKSDILRKKKSKVQFNKEELIQLEQLGKNNYDIIASKFSHLKDEIIEAKDFNSKKKPPPFDVLQNKIKETINKWKDSTSQEEKNNFDFLNNNFGLVKNHFGKYPVIFITFSRGTNDYLSPIKKSISKAYQQHLYLYRKYLIDFIGVFKNDVQDTEKVRLETKGVDETNLERNLYYLIQKYYPPLINLPKYKELEAFQRICSYNGKAATEDDLKYSIEFLSKLLFEHFDKKVFVLIDEYDAPINSLLKDPDALKMALELLKEMFAYGLKNSPYLEKSIITGILRLTKAELFSGLNNFSEYGVTTNKFSEYFGFTEKEVDHLLEETFGTSPNAEETEKIKFWYNGYRFGKTSVYNPWSMMQCLDTKNIDQYWIESGNPYLLETLFEQLQKNPEEMKNFEDLMKNGYFESKESLSTLINVSQVMTECKSFWPLLLLTGYLTHEDKSYETSNLKYRIPNKEVELYLKKMFLNKWSKQKFPQIDFNKLFNKILESMEDKNKLETFFQTEILDKLDSGDKNESDFQVLIGGAISLALLNQPVYKLISEVYVKIKDDDENTGRIDLMLTPTKKEPRSTPIIDEIKITKKGEDKNKVADNALWQIYSKRYMQKIFQLYDDYEHNRFWTNIITRGIVFDKDINGQWSLFIKEFNHTIDKARVLDAKFDVVNPKDLTHKIKHRANMARNNFLKEFKNLDQFLQFYSEINKNDEDNEKKIEVEKEEANRPNTRSKNNKRNYNTLKKETQNGK